MTRPATCHPERERYLKSGICRVCERKRRVAEARESRRRRCVVCARLFLPTKHDNVCCHDLCRRWRQRFIRSRRVGRKLDNYETTHDGRLASELVRALRARGLRRVGPRTARYHMAGGYYSAWKREHLYVVRWHDPDAAALSPSPPRRARGPRKGVRGRPGGGETKREEGTKA